MAPETALKLMENGEFEEVMSMKDVVMCSCYTGAKVPVDGVRSYPVKEGHEASITGSLFRC